MEEDHKKPQPLSQKKTWTQIYNLGKDKKAEWSNDAHKIDDWKKPQIETSKRNNDQAINDINDANKPDGKNSYSKQECYLVKSGKIQQREKTIVHRLKKAPEWLSTNVKTPQRSRGKTTINGND